MKSTNLLLIGLVMAFAVQNAISLRAPKHFAVRRRTQELEAAVRLNAADVLKPVEKVAILAPLIRSSMLIEALRYAGPLLFLGLQASSLITGKLDAID